MRFVMVGLLSALALAVCETTWTTTAEAATDVNADAVVHIARETPTHRLQLVEKLHVPYGPGSLLYAAPDVDKLARGPETFDVDPRGGWFVADPVRGEVVRVTAGAAKAVVTAVGALPVPYTDIGVDRDGTIHVFDGKTRNMFVLGSPTLSSKSLSILDLNARLTRNGQDLVLHAGGAASLLRRGALAAFRTVPKVEKCNAEAGLVTLGHDGKLVQIEIGASLASIRLIGVSSNQDTFLEIEQFRVRGRLAVDRRVVVLSSSGAFKASVALEGSAAVPVARDLVLGPRGDLHRMMPGDKGVTFSRWEVTP